MILRSSLVAVLRPARVSSRTIKPVESTAITESIRAIDLFIVVSIRIEVEGGSSGFYPEVDCVAR